MEVPRRGEGDEREQGYGDPGTIRWLVLVIARWWGLVLLRDFVDAGLREGME